MHVCMYVCSIVYLRMTGLPVSMHTHVHTSCTLACVFNHKAVICRSGWCVCGQKRILHRMALMEVNLVTSFAFNCPSNCWCGVNYNSLPFPMLSDFLLCACAFGFNMGDWAHVSTYIQVQHIQLAQLLFFHNIMGIYCTYIHTYVQENL